MAGRPEPLMGRPVDPPPPGGGGNKQGGGGSSTGGGGGFHSSAALSRHLVVQVGELGYQLDREAVAYVVEDTRLSTLQRKLIKEGDESVALALTCHINECLLYPENATYISRSSEVLQDAVMEVVGSKDHSHGVKMLCGISLGRMGALHTNFKDWQAWVWQQMDKAGDKEKQCLVFLGALEEALVRGGGSKEGVTRLLEGAKQRLEQTQSEVMMLALLTVVEAAARLWGVLFKVIFTEVVDIAVGWFMESGRMPDVRTRIAKALMSWAIFWQGEPEFAADQLGFYMEDLVLEVVGEDAPDLEDLEEGVEGSNIIQGISYKWGEDHIDKEDKARAHRQLIAFLQMVESVLLGVGGGANLALARLDGLSLPKLGLWLELIVGATRAGLKWHWTEDLALTSGRCLLAGLRVVEGLSMARMEEREDLITSFMLEVTVRSGRLCNEGLRTLCGLLSSLQGGQPHNSQLVTDVVLGPGGILPRVAMETTCPGLHTATVNLVQSLLQSKSVAVLTQVWQLVTSLGEEAVASLTFSPASCLKPIRARKQLAWVLACLSKLATTAGSVLFMWALDPSIFVLLSQHCGLSSPVMASQHPSLHYAVLFLLTQHSAAHSHFLSSSSLLSSLSTTSPTATHLSSFLATLVHLMGWDIASNKVRLLAVTSLCSTLTSVKGSADMMSNSSELYNMLTVSLETAYSSPFLRPAILDLLTLILEHFPPPAASQTELTALLLHIARAGDHDQADTARKLLAFLPPQVISIPCQLASIV